MKVLFFLLGFCIFIHARDSNWYAFHDNAECSGLPLVLSRGADGQNRFSGGNFDSLVQDVTCEQHLQRCFNDGDLNPECTDLYETGTDIAHTLLFDVDYETRTTEIVPIATVVWGDCVPSSIYRGCYVMWAPNGEITDLVNPEDVCCGQDTTVNISFDGMIPAEACCE
eukprot:TRINITY_DN2602_c0_g2_i1.p1 TRINITY_DN2602_c0_g2~~TRINITY_DN2602_c0_g2_i1.p1  ORF type:complete len:168 (+),score=20.09 TRINITY_DN2602_c0_g2_i1:116-619(+)